MYITFFIVSSSTKVSSSGTSHEIEPSHGVSYATYVAHALLMLVLMHVEPSVTKSSLNPVIISHHHVMY